MRTENHQDSTSEHDGVIVNLLLAAFWLTLSAIRWCTLIILAFLEPFVRLLLSAIAVLSVLAGLVYLGSSVPPPVPFWVTLCVALGCLLLISIYQGVLHLLSR
ncbi:hypothetical protein [Steroidobacter agaridevorans]|uniref:hypothetical protein n=1 Tax=Steroidobacter agaridevorans TaxID=2695856 RepID=UPI001329E864|nr:hypothetical protein [Steroidobacter agaridevorans]GFE87284.1 hypothetical protein GCM10011488_22380 [Steroidobacter agaridevorans]